MSTPDKPIIIIGGGWAGLSAAITLCKAKQPVLLLESAKQTGGRARCAPFGEEKVDNGQHLMVGAYHSFLGIMKQLGIDPDNAFYRHPVNLVLNSSKNDGIRLASAKLPAPLNIIAGLFKSKGIRLSEHLAITRFLLKQKRRDFNLDNDITVSELLAAEPDAINQKLWLPLCIATLNTPPDTASANIFLSVLRDSFMMAASDSDLLIPKKDLGSLFPEPAVSYIENNHGRVLLGKRVNMINISNEHALSVVADNETFEASHVVIATPHHQAANLTCDHEVMKSLTAQLQNIDTQPICTVYLKYPTYVQLDFPMQGFLGTTSQWVFDRRICGQHGMMAVVISADGPHMQLDKASLAQLVADELAEQFPGWPEHEDSLVIREKRATFSAVCGFDQRRPGHTTPINNLWLAGDYTEKAYPATLEAAVRSGVQCAQSILKHQENPHV